MGSEAAAVRVRNQLLEGADVVEKTAALRTDEIIVGMSTVKGYIRNTEPAGGEVGSKKPHLAEE